MAYQLIYTSAPRLLQSGRSGFGTVAKHPHIREALQREIERFSQFSRQEGMNPERIVLQYRCLSVAGEEFYVLSRIKDAGADYTGRTNHIAHHVVFTESEAVAAKVAGFTQVDVLFHLNEKQLWKDCWNDEPIELGSEWEISIGEFSQVLRLPASNWKNITGEFSSAAILAPGQIAESCWVVFDHNWPPGSLPVLFGESLQLHSNPWRVSFANEFQPTDRVEEIAWRGIPDTSPLRPTAAQSVRPTLDLTRISELQQPVKEFTSRAANTNQFLSSRPQYTPNYFGFTAPEFSASQPSLITPTSSENTPKNDPVVRHRKISIEKLRQGIQEESENARRYFIRKYWHYALVASLVLFTAGVGVLYQHIKTQDRENAKRELTQSYLHFTRDILKVDSLCPKMPDSVDPQSIRKAATIIQHACSEYYSSKKNAIEILGTDRPESGDIQNLLNNISYKLKTKAAEDIEIKCLNIVMNGKYEKLESELSESTCLDDQLSQKLKRFKVFFDYWKSNSYPDLVTYIQDKKNNLVAGIPMLDKRISEQLYYNVKVKTSVVEKIHAENHELFSQLTKVDTSIKEIENKNEVMPKQSTQVIDTAKDQASLNSRVSTASHDITWTLCDTIDNIDNYEKAAKTKAIGKIYCPETAEGDQFQLLMDCLNNKHLNAQVSNAAQTNKALKSSFFIICDEKGTPKSGFLNLLRFRTQKIARTLVDVGATSLSIKEPLFGFLCGEIVMDPSTTRVRFYYKYSSDGIPQSIVDQSISSQKDFDIAKRQWGEIFEQIKNIDFPVFTNEDNQQFQKVEEWLGSWCDKTSGDLAKSPAVSSDLNKSNDAKAKPLVDKPSPISELFPIEHRFKLYSYLKEVAKLTPFPSDFRAFLSNPKADQLIDDYIRAAFKAFIDEKGTSYSEKAGWSKTYAESTAQIRSEFKPGSTFAAALNRARKRVDDSPLPVKSACNQIAVEGANALDSLLDKYGKQKKRLEDKLKKAEETMRQYSDLSQSIEFLAISDENNTILSLKIAPPASSPTP